jgi:hypothetical protein
MNLDPLLTFSSSVGVALGDALMANLFTERRERQLPKSCGLEAFR